MILLGALLPLILLGIGRVEMDVDILELLPPKLPEVQGLQQFLEHFSNDDEVILRSIYMAISGNGLHHKYSNKEVALVLGINRKTAGKRLKEGIYRRRLFDSGDSSALTLQVKAKGCKKLTKEAEAAAIKFIRESRHVRLSLIKKMS